MTERNGVPSILLTPYAYDPNINTKCTVDDTRRSFSILNDVIVQTMSDVRPCCTDASLWKTHLHLNHGPS
jgi:hypothetical protein